MQAHEVLTVHEYDADAVDLVEEGGRVLDAVRAVDTPFLPALTPFRRTMDVRHGWDGSPELHLLGLVDGVTVAAADVELGEWDNRDLAWISLVVDPAHRRRGLGSALLVQAIELCRQRGRTRFGAWAWETAAGVPFAHRHGFVLGQVETYRVLAPHELPPGHLDALYNEAAAYAEDYVLTRIAGRTPEELVADVSMLSSVINDAPTDNLDVEDEVFPVQRIRDFEEATIASGHRLHRVIARHRDTGEAAGHTVVAVDSEQPTVAHQDDTSVVRAHRGHRLGLLLKAEMLRWLAEAEPQVASIDTDNAESNTAMVRVNERLGYRAVGRILQLQQPGLGD